MAKKSRKAMRVGDLQLRILQVLWEARVPVTVADVQRSLTGSRLAYTTVATMLRKMENRELVGHEEAGRKFLYTPRVTADEVSRTISRDLVDRLFSGSLTDAVNHLLESRDVDARELDKLEELIRRHRKER